MKIEEIDKNFAKKTVRTENGILYEIPSSSFSLYGLIYDEERGFLRIPYETAKRFNDGVFYLNAHTAGGRLAFKTNSAHIKIKVEWEKIEFMHHMALTGLAGFTLKERTENGEKFSAKFAPSIEDGKGFEASAALSGKSSEYVLYFPLYNAVKRLWVELDGDATVEKGRAYRYEKPVVYYGSSITQGGCASRPDNSYQSLISDWLDTNYLNFGFSGSALGEKEMAEYLSKIDCSVFVMDYDHNAPNKEHLMKTHKPFYETFRKGNPNVPIVFVTKPDDSWDAGIQYDEIQKVRAERAEVIKETYEYALKNGDKNVYFIDGRTFYPEDVKEHCAVDNCHPTDLGFYFMAKTIGKVIKDLIVK